MLAVWFIGPEKRLRGADIKVKKKVKQKVKNSGVPPFQTNPSNSHLGCIWTCCVYRKTEQWLVIKEIKSKNTYWACSKNNTKPIHVIPKWRNEQFQMMVQDNPTCNIPYHTCTVCPCSFLCKRSLQLNTQLKQLGGSLMRNRPESNIQYCQPKWQISDLGLLMLDTYG